MENNGYIIVRRPDHPHAWSTGYVYEHRLVIEDVLKRYLKPDEVIHHRDGNKQNNHPDNLEVLTHSKHAKLHNTRGTTMVDLVCDFCGKPFQRRKGHEPTAKRQNKPYCNRHCYWSHLRAWSSRL